MNNILILGAGRSATALIKYVLEQAGKHNWFVMVADVNHALVSRKVGRHPNGRAVWVDVNRVVERRELIGRSDVVVSLLPPNLHIEVAYDCIALKKNLVTASYVSKDVYKLSDEFRNKELIFMGELGLDPGIDHMSVMRCVEEIKSKGGKITAFRSYSGGLIAPDCCDKNPWKYKFTWHPRNVILAGQGTAQYLENGRLHYIPYNRVFKEYRLMEFPGFEMPFEVYANREALLYREIYGLGDVPTVFRGTMRYRGFCDAWNALVQLGLTDSDYPIMDSANISYHQLMEAYAGTSAQGGGSVKSRIANMLGEKEFSPIMKKLDWLGLFSKKPIGLSNATPALILEHLLAEKWKLRPGDHDIIIMKHEFEYTLGAEQRRLQSTLYLEGTDTQDTALSSVIGLPLGIFAKLVLTSKITAKGVHIPVQKEVYEPVLRELEEFGIVFNESDTLITK